MKRFLLGIAAVGFAAVPLACDNPFATDQSLRLNVTEIDAPSTISAGSALTVTLTVQTGGCLRFDHFEIQRRASFASVTAWGEDGAKGKPGMACTADVRFEPRSYTFDPPFESPFTVQVDRGRLSPLTAVVQVQ
jgi:hypothetical protein